MTLGQIAFEAFCGVPVAYRAGWDELDDNERARWERVAEVVKKAAICDAVEDTDRLYDGEG